MLREFPPLTAALLILAAILGAVMGSFLNCAAWRLAHGESVIRGRSHCDRCGHTLGALDLIPIASHIGLRGRCRYCGQPISRRCPAAEAVCALCYCTLLWRFDVTWGCLRYGILLSLLLMGALVDLEDGWIPDRVSVLAALCYVPLALPEGGWRMVGSGALSAVALLLPLMAVVALMEKRMNTEVMGGGDLKLLAVLGLYFGWKQGLFLILAACVLGLAGMAVTGRLAKGVRTPFAPALFLSAWLTALVGQAAVDWYWGLF